MKLEVLGTGCAKCDTLESTVRATADRLGLDYTLDHVKELAKIASYGVMLTPALVVDGKVVCSGKLPSEAEIEQHLQTATS